MELGRGGVACSRPRLALHHAPALLQAHAQPRQRPHV
eukprot:CAMPEP_0179936978 /NCGR_PEP_ID=MMETSP0983-20121128/14044_1 /TAXON_ID=483367 /ORGANISM="non described non described, Strain CCMP 2436" /LENGTH=36 /DNA_ID= /DNA_START= /DNA_END= /DNA_ORIENTATION=